MTPSRDVVADVYLAELDLALERLPAQVRREIHAGIAEELGRLEGDALQLRIDELGDPFAIAAAALDETAVQVKPDGPSQLREQDKTWYTLTTVFALLFAGVIVPFLGWFAGVVLLWNSKT